MSNLKWSEKFFTRVSGMKRVEIKLYPANFWQYVKFLFFRQSYQSAIKQVVIKSKSGIELEPEVVQKKFGFSGCVEIKFYFFRNDQEYTIDCYLDERCDGWHLKYAIRGVNN